MSPALRHACHGLAVLTLTLLPWTTPSPLAAQEPDSARIAELERQIQAITRELERLDLGGDVVVADTSVLGLGPAASKVYRVERGVSIGGYGEFLYENYGAEDQAGTPSGRTDQLDALRAIVYVGYKFNDRLVLNTEIEVEHADEIYLEFAYVDYFVTDGFGVRGGMLLAPLGLVNELHEPSVFLGTERSVTETRIIPTTWRENGIGVFGGSDALAWRVYLMNSLDGSGFNGSGLRGGRQKGSRTLAEDFGIAGRLDYTGTPGLLVGASAYTGNTGQGRELQGEVVGGRVTIWDAHLDFKRGGWDLRGLIAGAAVGDAAKLNELEGLVGADGIGSRMLGWYVHAGYDVLRHTSLQAQLLPYVRFEQVDTQREVAPGYDFDLANDLTVTSVGFAWKPIPQIVTKVDYQFHSDPVETGVNQFNIALGWLF